MRTLHANGLNFAVDEAGSGPDVALCLHGFPESRAAWRRQLPALAAAGWHAVAPDLRGYGDSDRPPRRDDYRIDKLVDDAAGLFDALDARRRILVGHDWGGLIAWEFALRQARPLDGLVILNAPHPAVLRRALRHSWRQRGRSWYVAFFQLPWLPEAVLTAGHAWAVGAALRRSAVYPDAWPADLLDRYRAAATRPGAMRAMLNYYRANARWLVRDAPTPVIRTPTLVIWGERDTALGPELTDGMGPLVADLTPERLPNVSHWVQHEAAETVNARVAGWLTARVKPEPSTRLSV